MLNNVRTTHEEIRWEIGSAKSIPLDDDSVNGIVATLTVHHWRNLEESFEELNRVLK